MVRVVIGYMYSSWSPKYSWDEKWKSRPLVEAKCRALMAKGYDVKFSDCDGERTFYIEFEDETEAVLFKLTST